MSKNSKKKSPISRVDWQKIGRAYKQAIKTKSAGEFKKSSLAGEPCSASESGTHRNSDKRL